MFGMKRTSRNPGCRPFFCVSIIRLIVGSAVVGRKKEVGNHCSRDAVKASQRGFGDPCMQEEVTDRPEISGPRTRNRFDGRVLSWAGGHAYPLIKSKPWERMPFHSAK